MKNTTKNTKTILFASLIAITIAIPVSVYAVDQVDFEIAAKERLQEIIDKLHADIAKDNNIEEIERLEKMLAGAMDFKNATQIVEQLSTATGETQQELLADLKEVEARLHEHAGDRVAHTVIVPEGQNDTVQQNNPTDDTSTQSFWIQTAYAVDEHLNDFEFVKQYDSCYSGNHSMELSGIINTNDHTMSLNWLFPDDMYVTNLADDNPNDNINTCVYIDFDQADLFHYGFDNDGTYYCGASIPGYHYGVASYQCPFASSGEFNYLFVTVDYEGDDSENDRDIRLHPWIKLLILG